MQAILTKYLGATDTKGSRVKAICAAGSVTRAWDSALSVEDNHRAAACALVHELDWTVKSGYEGQWVGGCLPNGDYAYCLVVANNSFRG